jgi:hypothetical protein
MTDHTRIADRVQRLWARPEVQAHVDAINALDSGDSPMHNFVGFNLTRDHLLNAKVNHHHFRRLDDATLDRLVPVREVFDRVYPKWQPNEVRSSRETGSAFVVKVKASGPATYQFHFRFPFQRDDFETLGIAPHELDLTNYSLNPGISYEYTGDEVLRKLYYYLNRPEEKAVVARQFGEPWCERADMLEYTQTDKARKVILWMFDSDECAAYLRGLNWPLMDELIEYMATFGCVPTFPGVYEGGDIRAVYFFRFPLQVADAWSQPENHQIRTLDSIPLLARPPLTPVRP